MRNEEGSAAQQDLLKALNHPLRRRIIRALHEGDEARSPCQLGRSLHVAVSNVSYHVRVLQDNGLIVLTGRRPVRGSTEHFYASTVAANELAVQLLESTAEGDLRS